MFLGEGIGGGGGRLSTLASLTRLLLPWACFHQGSWMRPLLVYPREHLCLLSALLKAFPVRWESHCHVNEPIKSRSQGPALGSPQPLL